MSFTTTAPLLPLIKNHAQIFFSLRPKNKITLALSKITFLYSRFCGTPLVSPSVWDDLRETDTAVMSRICKITHWSIVLSLPIKELKPSYFFQEPLPPLSRVIFFASPPYSWPNTKPLVTLQRKKMTPTGRTLKHMRDRTLINTLELI